MSRPSNPFMISGYHSPEYFCDREAELAWLLERFKNERNAVLHSWRRMGKTTLLRHFFRHLETKKLGDAVFVDLLGTTSLAEANKRIASAITLQFGEFHTGIGSHLLKLIGSIGATVGMDTANGKPQPTFALVHNSSVPASDTLMMRWLQEI